MARVLDSSLKTMRCHLLPVLLRHKTDLIGEGSRIEPKQFTFPVLLEVSTVLR